MVEALRSVPTPGDLECEHCPYRAVSPQSLGIHKSRVHGIKGTKSASAHRERKAAKAKEAEKPLRQRKVTTMAEAPLLPLLGTQVQVTLLALDPETGQVTIGLNGRWRAVLT